MSLQEAIVQLHPLFKPIILESLKEFQQEKGTGAFEMEINAKADSKLDPLAANGVPKSMLMFSLQKMVFENEIFISRDCTQFSLTPLEGYRKWEDILKTTLQGHQLNEKLELYATSAPTINYELLMKILLNKDPEHLVEETKTFEKNFEEHGPLLLDEKCKAIQIFQGSLMRAGSTFIRKLLESVSGVSSGSNFPNSVPCNAAMVELGFKGEQIEDNRVWFKKTHFPYNFPGLTFPQNGSKAVIATRNPQDIIPSMFHVNLTMTHTKSCANDIAKEFPEEWDTMVNYATKVYSEFYSYWMKAQKNKDIPVLFIRYEDLLTKKKECLSEIMRFCLGVDTIEGTYIQKRIETILSKGEQGVLYKPRSGQANANASLYTPAQLEKIQSVCKEAIQFFGYDCETQQESGPESGFLKGNEEALKGYLAEKEKFDSQEITLHKPGEGIILEAKDEPHEFLKNIRHKVVLN